MIVKKYVGLNVYSFNLGLVKLEYLQFVGASRHEANKIRIK